MSDDEPQSLRSLYEAAESKRSELEATPFATSPSYRTTLHQAIKLYEQCRAQIAKLSLFSTNEALEDVSTSAIPYLGVDFQLGELVQKTPALEPADRKSAAAEARTAYERFLGLIDAYQLVSEPPYNKLLERYRDNEVGFAVVAGADASRRRDAKISNFKAEKELREKLAILKRNPRYLDEGDEEIARHVYVADLKWKVHQTFQALDGLNRELEMLAMAPQRPQVPSPPQGGPGASQGKDSRSRGRPESAGDGDTRLDAPLRDFMNRQGPLLSSAGKPLQPFTLVGSRQDLAKNVFRPSHNLPTMSIDEYLEEERRRGGIIEGTGDEPKPEVDEDDMAYVDRETYKAREWDEYKDANPKGSGNTLNRG